MQVSCPRGLSYGRPFSAANSIRLKIVLAHRVQRSLPTSHSSMVRTSCGTDLAVLSLEKFGERSAFPHVLAPHRVETKEGTGWRTLRSPVYSMNMRIY